MIAVDRDNLLLVSGTGDVIQPTRRRRRHRLGRQLRPGGGAALAWPIPS